MRKIIIIMIAVLCLSSFAVADSLKLAYIDTDRVMMECSDTQEAQRQFEAEQQTWNQEIEEMDTEIQQLNNEFEQKQLILTESGKEEFRTKITELLQERDRRVSEVFGEGGLAMQKNEELLEPILTKLRDIIDDISTEQNIDMVFDASTGGILYAVPKLDITEDVIDRMNKLTDTEDDN